MAHEAFDAKIRRGRLRIGLACADLADLETQLRRQQSGLHHKFYNTGGRSGADGTVAAEGLATINARISGLRGEISQAKDVVRDWVAKRDEQVQALWDEVRASWDGAVREVVRDDGSGEELERCVFRVTLVSLADADADAGVDVAVGEDGGVKGSDGEMEGGWRVRVVWEMIS